jgi:hypothetical protein
LLNQPSSASGDPAPRDAGGSAPFGLIVSDALRYWEPRRVAYNLVLAGIVLGWVGFTWPHFRPAFSRQSLLPLSVLAVLANVCYCAAYLADIPLQYSIYRSAWRRWRWALWLLGTLLASAMAFYWIADEIYPAVS